MFTLREAWLRLFGSEPVRDWDGRLVCFETNAAGALRIGQSYGSVAGYIFTLVVAGQIEAVFNGRRLTLKADDLFCHSPGLMCSVTHVSDDYHGIVLGADKDLTFETSVARHLIHVAYSPMAEVVIPKRTLSHDKAERLAIRMREIIGYLHSDHCYRDEILRMLYAVFLLEMKNQEPNEPPHPPISQRTEEIVIAFLQLLSRHFVEHHDIGFYASSLHISTVYLSRVVRQATGHTVVDYINQLLLMEASFLLRTSQQSIAQIADTLHFADAASFSKFFSRGKGMSPREFRES